MSATPGADKDPREGNGAADRRATPKVKELLLAIHVLLLVVLVASLKEPLPRSSWGKAISCQPENSYCQEAYPISEASNPGQRCIPYHSPVNTYAACILAAPSPPAL